MENHVSQKTEMENHEHRILPILFFCFDSISMFELEKQYMYKNNPNQTIQNNIKNPNQINKKTPHLCNIWSL